MYEASHVPYQTYGGEGQQKKISLFPVSDTAVSGSKEKEIAFV